jgi:hypothetical protein
MIEFQGNGFSVWVPNGWIDQTVYRFADDSDEGPEKGIRGTAESVAGSISLEEFADLKLRAMLDLPGTRLLTRKTVPVAEGFLAVRAEIRWVSEGNPPIFQRVMVCLHGQDGLVLHSTFFKKSRKIHGPLVDRVLNSARMRADGKSRMPPDGFQDGQGGPDGQKQVHVGPFSLDIPQEWVDKTLYLLSEPDDSQFRRNLVIRVADLEEIEAAPDEVVDGEMEGLKATVKGLEVLSREEETQADGGPGTRVSCLRPVEDGARVRQDLLLALRDQKLFSLTVTMEEDPPPEVAEELERITSSFRAIPNGVGEPIGAAHLERRPLANG